MNQNVNVSNIIAKVPELEDILLNHFKNDYSLSFFDDIQVSIKSYCQNKENDFYIKCMSDVYGAILNELMRANHHITDVEHIFFIYTYVDKILTYKYIVYIYEYLSDENRIVLNNRLLIFIYINVLKYLNDYYHKKITYDEYRVHYRDNVTLVKLLYDGNYITNPLYSKNEDINDEDYYTISLFDFFVHGTYVFDYIDLGKFVIDIIMYNNDHQKYTNEDWNELFANYVNIDSLYMLDSYTKNVGRMCIESMDEDFGEHNFYDYYFFYYFNVFYISLLKDKVENRDYLLFLDENLICMWITNNVKIIELSNTFLFDNLVEFLKHVIRVNNLLLSNYIIHLLENSELTTIVHTYIVTMMTRMIYYKLPKYVEMMVKYDKKKNEYFIEYYDEKTEEDKLVIFNIVDYVNDIKEFMSQCTDSMMQYMMKYFSNYVNTIYPELKVIENRKCDNISCSICMEDISCGDVTICDGCKNIFHKKCQMDLFSSRHQFCPLCRRCIYSTMVLNVDIRYELFIKLL